MMSVKKVDVLMSTGRITLRSDESPEYLQKLASFVDQKITDLKAKNLSASVDERRRSLFIAMNLADDYFKLKDRYTAQDVENTKLNQENFRLEKENAALNERVKTLQAELERVNAEYDEFLHNFDNGKTDTAVKIEDEEIIPLAAKPDKRKAAI